MNSDLINPRTLARLRQRVLARRLPVLAERAATALDTPTSLRGKEAANAKASLSHRQEDEAAFLTLTGRGLNARLYGSWDQAPDGLLESLKQSLKTGRNQTRSSS
jgi:hypothetical protein